MAVIMKSRKGQQKKKLKGKAKKVFQKCVVDKRLLSSQPESDRTLPASSEHTKTIHPAEVRPEPAGVSGDSDMASTPEASYIDQLPVEPEKSSSEDFDMTSTLQDSCHKPVNKPATQVLLCENQTESSIATPTKLGSKSHQQDQDLFKIKGVSKSPKRMKQKRKVCRKEFFKFYLKNSNSGFHQALKKFHHKKLVQSLKHSPAGGVKSEHRQAVDINDSIQKKAPLKIVVKGRLSSSGVAQSLCPSTIKPPVTPSTPLKMLSRLNVPIHKSTTHSVVSCKVPLESSFEAASPDEDDGTSLNTNENEVSQASKREVCYIFALLDREKDETLFKCSPQVKTSKILQQIATVIDSISADEDLMISKKVYATDHDECLERPSRIDQSTSPIPLPAEPIEEGSQFPPAAEDVPNPSEEENSDDSGMQSDIERKDRMLNATAKVIISKALLSFTSELKVLTDVSIRLLGWCAGTVKADLDSDSFEDEFEGFLCHCHDKVSILIECLHELDLRQILNVDEVEVHRFWLLHDALRCMLQAYRYIQSSSATGHLSQKLLSLLMTCSKTVLPSGSISLTRWVSLMTMISGISRKLCEARLLSNACLCYQHFESLRKGRSCRVCDLQCLFKEVCKTEPLNSKRVNGKSSAACAAKTAVEQLFPRFCLFLSEVEGLSEEEFMTAFKKHSVVKFSCNPQSALYPCDAHLSGIACNCFAVSTDFEEERTVCEGETINGFSDVHNVLNESSVQQIVPLCERDAEEDSPNAQKCSAEAGQNTAPSSNSKVLSGSKVIEVSLENSESSIDSVDTILLQNNGSKSQESDQVVLLNKGSSESSSEDFSLRMPESSNSDPQSSTALCHASEDDTASTDDVQGPSCSMITNPPESPFHRQVSLANLKGRNLNDDSDFDFSVSLSSNCDIDYSHPVFQVAESSIKTALSGNESDSILSVADSQSSAMEPSPEAEFMQDLSVGNDSVFKPSSGVYLKEQTSICPQMGLDSSSMDETHSSQGSEDKHSQKLRSPPPFHVETTLEDTDSSVEMPAFGRVAQGIVSSTQGKNVDLKSSVPLIDHKERANSTHTKETFQIQRMKEDCKRRVLQGLRSLEATRVSPPPEENDLNQRSICTRRQHSSRETGEERGTKTGKTSVANQSTPCQTVSETVLEMGVVDQHVGPEDARNFHSNESVMKKSDKKVTFSDILQFKEFTDSPLLGYGRCKRTHVQERIESLLTELFPLDTGNSDDGGPSTKSRNLEENKDDVADVAPAAVEKDSLKSRKRKLSLQRSKVNPPSDPPKENDQNLKRATRSSTYTNEVSDKQKQNCILDEKFRKTFEKNEGTECIVARKPDSRLKRTMNDLEEDADDELLGNNKKCKNEKKLRTLEPMKSDDAVLQNKMTVDDPKIIKSCLKKTTKTQADTGVLSNINPLQIHKDKFDKTKSGNKDEEESQDVPMQVQPKQAPKSDSGSVSEQKSHQTSRKTTRRMVKEMKEKLYREELKSMTEQTEVIPKSNNDDDQNAEKVKSKKGKKVSISNIWMPGNVEEKSGATNKKTGSKRSKSNLMEDFQRNNNSGQEHCINRDLNVSDADWKMYITDLGKKMLDN